MRLLAPGLLSWRVPADPLCRVDPRIDLLEDRRGVRPRTFDKGIVVSRVGVANGEPALSAEYRLHDPSSGLDVVHRSPLPVVLPSQLDTTRGLAVKRSVA